MRFHCGLLLTCQKTLCIRLCGGFQGRMHAAGNPQHLQGLHSLDINMDRGHWFGLRRTVLCESPEASHSLRKGSEREDQQQSWLWIAGLTWFRSLPVLGSSAVTSVWTTGCRSFGDSIAVQLLRQFLSTRNSPPSCQVWGVFNWLARHYRTGP